MKLLMGSVFARASRRDKLHLDSQFHPPGTEPAQPGRSRARKRCTIIAPHPLGKPVLTEDPNKLLASSFQVSGAQQRHPQTISTVKITNRQGLDSQTIFSAIATFKVDRPNIMTVPRRP